MQSARRSYYTFPFGLAIRQANCHAVREDLDDCNYLNSSTYWNSWCKGRCLSKCAKIHLVTLRVQ